MKFDLILMNPPYDRNLHLKILAEAITHLKYDNSKVVNLSPVRWLQDPLAKYKEKNYYNRFEDKISKHCTSIETIRTEDARKLFDAELSQPLGIYCCDKSNNNNVYKNVFKVHDFVDRVYKKILEDNVFNSLTCKKYTDDLQHFVLINTAAPPMKYGKPMFDAVKTWCGYFCNGKNINGLTYRQAKEKNTRATRGDISKDNAIVFKTADEAKNCYNAMQTKFVRFFVMTSVVDMAVYQNVLPWMSDYTQPWTDERFYEFFNITPEEQKIIEETMAKKVNNIITT